MNCHRLFHEFLLLAASVCVSPFSFAAPGDISTIAGTGAAASSGDDGPATAAELNFVGGVAVDAEGNVYVSDVLGHRIRKVDVDTGIISTVVGTGVAGFNGDGKTGLETQIDRPFGIQFGPDGALYFSDFNNDRLRRLDPQTNRVTTYLGTGMGSFNGYGMHRTETNINATGGFHFLPNGDLLFPLANIARVLYVDGETGIVSQLIGDGTAVEGGSGDGGPAVDARVFQPFSCAGDSEGNIYIGDLRVIRRIDAVTGIVTTISGDGTQAYTGDAGVAQMDYVRGLLIDDADNIFFGDEGFAVIRRIDGETNIITTIAGTGTSGYSGDGGPATNAQLNGPQGLALDRDRNLYVAEFSGNKVRKIEAAAVIKQRAVDMTIGPKARTQRGRGIVNTSGAGQTIRLESKTKKLLRFYFSVRNGGEVVDTIRVSATRAKRTFRTKYIQIGRGNVTAQLLKGNLHERVAIGGSANFAGKMKPKSRKGGKRQILSIAASSGTWNDKKDLVRTKVKVKLPHRTGAN